MKKIIVKISGKIINNNDAFRSLLLDIHALIKGANQMHAQDSPQKLDAKQIPTSEPCQCVLVHGGGAMLSEYCASQHIATQFDALGRRITSKQEMDASDRVLSGTINTSIVRMCSAQHIAAVGLSGADCELLIGTRIGDTYTGIAHACNTQILDILCSQEILPVVSSVACTKDGVALNINADDFAEAIAHEWGASILIFVSDVPGILNKRGEAIRKMSSPELSEFIEKKIITGGMIIKSHNIQKALKSGLDTIVIGQHTKAGDLSRLLENQIGTKILGAHTHEI